jgi:hypothetical protein
VHLRTMSAVLTEAWRNHPERTFEEADIISRDGLDEVFGSRELPQSYSEVVCVIEGIEKILVCLNI